MNRVQMIVHLVQGGLETADAVKVAEQALKDRASFFTRLCEAQRGMATILKSAHNAFKDFDYADGDQMIGKAKDTCAEAGLAVFECEAIVINKGGGVDRDGIEQIEKIWEIGVVAGDTKSGHQATLTWQVPIGKEAAVGASDTYAMKYMVRGLLLAERSANDPEKNNDPDSTQNMRSGEPAKRKKDTPPRKPKPANKTKKPTKGQMEDRVARAKDRLRGCREKLGEGLTTELLGALKPKNVDDFERAAVLLESRCMFEDMLIKTVDRIGQPEADIILDAHAPFTEVTNIKNGIAALAARLNKEAS